MPKAAGFGDVAALSGVDSVQMSHSLAMLRVLPVGDKYLVFPDHWSGDHFIAGLRPHRVLGIQIKFPKFLAGQRLIAAHPTVAFPYYDLHYVPDLTHRW